MKKADLLKELTEKQKEAVCHINGPALVVAGAGTGKTTVITKRIAWLIKNKHAKPEEVLALTFTEKAANEMLSRVDSISDYVYSNLSISTFNSFGAEIVGEFSYELGLPSDVRVLSDAELNLFLRDNIFEFNFNHYKNLSEPTSLISDLIKVFSRAKDELVDPDIWIKKAKQRIKKSKDEADIEEGEKDLEIAEAFKKYNEILHTNGYIDYGDQVLMVLRLLEKPSVARIILNRYKYVLVDEFQDTNFAQSAMVKKIFGEGGNVMVVGDDDQSIYRFRGASVSNILNFKKDYKDVKTFILNDNFRSYQKILDASYGFIKNNDPNRLESKYKINKKLVSALGEGDAPSLNFFYDETKEASFVADIIEKKVKEGASLSDFAILVRANRHAENFLLALKNRQIPYVFAGMSNLYAKNEIKNLISIVSVLSNPEDDLSFFHLAASEIYGVDMKDLARLTSLSKQKSKPLSEVFREAESLLGETDIKKVTVKKVLKIITNVDFLREESRTLTAGEVVNLFLRESGYYKKLTKSANEGSQEAHYKISNIAVFFDRIIHFQKNYRDHSLEKFARYLDLMMEVGADSKESSLEEGLNAVSVFSMHKAKGLEFENVFIVSLSDSHIPSQNKNKGFPLPDYLVRGKIEKSQNANTEEERRLLYVAMTRAKKSLYLTASLDYGTKRTHKASRFLAEIFGKEKIESRFLKTESIERIRGFEKVSGFYKVPFVPIPDSEVIMLSRAAIDDYQTCPFKYQLIHVTPIRIVANASVAYGNTIHNTINEYFKIRMAGGSVNFKMMRAWYDVFWSDSGFLSAEHKKMRYLEGIDALRRFFINAQKSPLPRYFEKEFRLRLGNNIIKGRYDAVYESNGLVEIVDFKTSNIKSPKKAEERTKKSTQLAMYALSWYENNNQLPGALKLYFVGSGLIGSTSPSEKQVEKTREKALQACRGIRERNYQATPDLNTCKYCPFVFYCPEAVRKKIEE